MSSTISAITSGLTSLGANASFAFTSVAATSGHLFSSIFYSPASSVIGAVAAKANALTAPVLGAAAPFVGPALAVGVTATLGFAANRLYRTTETDSITKPLIKVIAVAAAIFAGCAAAATVALVAPALPVYASIALGATVAGASLVLPVDVEKVKGWVPEFLTAKKGPAATEPAPAQATAPATI